MFSKGMGIVYSHTDSGELLRIVSEAKKRYIIENFYVPYHEDLEKTVEEKLEKYGECLIIDCHSFSDTPLNRDLDQEPDRPDICIGTDSFHTPQTLENLFVSYFCGLGYRVKTNSPYSGSLVPLRYYQKNRHVKSIMIELNKKLYMSDDGSNFEKLHSEIENLYHRLKLLSKQAGQSL